MKQRIVHGATIETVTPDEVAAILRANTPKTRGAQYHTDKVSVQLDGTGAGQARIATTREYSRRLQRVAVKATPLAAALCLIYDNSTEDGDLREVIQLGIAGLYSDGFSNNMFIPAGNQILFVVTGGAAGGAVAFNIQSELVQVER